MVVKVHTTKTVEIEVNDKVVEELHKIHQNPHVCGEDEQYDEAMRKICELMGLPLYETDPTKQQVGVEYVYAAYGRDDVPIFET